jgi:hypothetical protein
METAPCSIVIDPDADEVLGRPAFPFIKQLLNARSSSKRATVNGEQLKSFN